MAFARWLTEAVPNKPQVESPKLYSSNGFQGIVSAFVALLLFIWGLVDKQHMPLILIIAWAVGTCVFWLIARGTTRVRGLRLLIVLSGSLLLAGFFGWIYKHFSPKVNVSIALITTIERMKDPHGGYMKGGQYDLFAVVRVEQINGVRTRHLQSLQVVGDVLADYGSFLVTFGKNDGTESMSDIDSKFESFKPFYHLSWVVFPLEQSTIDESDVKYIKVQISNSLGETTWPFDSRTSSAKDCFGFESTNQKPKFPMTVPTWNQLVQFTKINKQDSIWIYPTLRDEVKNGKVKIQVNLDGQIIDVPVENIKFPWPVSLSQYSIEKTVPQDLFYGIDNGLRTGIPTPDDPLLQKTNP